MPTVSMKKVSGDLVPAVEVLAQPFISERALQGKSVLIKPNLVEPLPYTSGQTTNPALVEAIIMWLRKEGAGSVVVGEGPSYFQPRERLRDCFLRTGMAAAAQRQSAAWVLFDEGEFREFAQVSENVPNRFHISEHAFAYDAIINVPVPKTHYLTGVSIAMKNLKGFIRREEKPSFHYCGPEGIHGAVTELNKLIRPTLNIADCTAPCHRNGNFLLAGADIVAVDAVMASLMGVNPQSVRMLQLGSAAGLGEVDCARIEVVGDDLKGLRMNVEQPASYVRRVFPEVCLDATSACSGCLIPLFAALRRLEETGAVIDGPVTIRCGKDAGRPAGEGACCSVGRCAGAGTGSLPELAVCPPTKEEVYVFL
ncbi:MAG: DUF362 domain-containing protein, partial [Deltaproteobacteria bacterium]|nr:DUF362 domain-containing protein [Deltaproteobacteria bacterium]